MSEMLKVATFPWAHETGEESPRTPTPRAGTKLFPYSKEESPRTPTPRAGAAFFQYERAAEKESPWIPTQREGTVLFWHEHDTGEESPRTPTPRASLTRLGQVPAPQQLRELPPSPPVQLATSESPPHHCGLFTSADARCRLEPLLHLPGGSSGAQRLVQGGSSLLGPPPVQASHPATSHPALALPPPQPSRLPAVPPLRRFIVVDGSATSSDWGVGAAVVGPSLRREPGDPMSRWDWCGGGSKADFFAEQRRLGRKDDTSAVAEAVALLAGLMLDAEFCQDQGIKTLLPIITDKASILSNLDGRGNAGPALEAACSKIALSLMDLVRHHGQVIFLNKHKIEAMRNTHNWLPDKLAARGRIAGGMGEPPGPPVPADWRSWFQFRFDGEDPSSPVSLTVSARALPVAGAFEFCNRLPRGGTAAAAV